METPHVDHAGTQQGAIVRDIRTAPGAVRRSQAFAPYTPSITTASWGRSAAVPEAAPEVAAVPVSEPPACPTKGLFERLRDRKFIQWTAAYLGAAWLVLQLTDILTQTWGWSLLLQQIVSLVVGLGVMPALVVAWYHGEKGRQEICATECAVVAATIMGSVMVVWSLCARAAL